MAATYQGIVPATIESARVLDVDITNYTLAISTQYSKKPQTGITWSSPYLHFVNGEGMYIMPEVGSLCWVCFPSDSNRAFVLGWQPAGDEGDYRARRMELNPGDIYMGTRDENFMILRRGGIVQIGGGPLCQRMFLPINNTIRDFCENYALHSLGGDLEWSIQREENTTDGKRPAQFSLKAKEFANDPLPIAQLLVGSHGEGDDTILTLLVKASGQEGAAQQLSLKLDKKGNVSWVVAKDVKWKVAGAFTVEAQKDITLKSSARVMVSAGSTMNIAAKNGLSITSIHGTVTIRGTPLIRLGQKVEVGSSPQPVMLAGPLLQWLATHIHTAPPGGGATTPPTVPPSTIKDLVSSKTLSAS